MQFKSWLKAERGRAVAVARALDIAQSFVSKMANGEKDIPAEHCKAIEKLTGGEVTCREMRPMDWHKYWPELTAQAQQPAEQGVQHV